MPHEAPRLAAALTYDLPLEVITEARWIAETLEALMPERRCLLVRNGIDKDVFAPVAAPPVRGGGEPLRILIEGNPGVWFKGVGEALAAVRADAGAADRDDGHARRRASCAAPTSRSGRSPSASWPWSTRSTTSCSSSRASRGCSARRWRASTRARRA